MSDEARDGRDVRRAPPKVAALALRQGGAVSTRQCRELGLDKDALLRLRRKGWLRGHHRGVLRLGTLTPDGVLWAAVLAMDDPDTSISLYSAGHEHTVLRGPRPRVVHVSTPTQRRRRRGIVPRRAELGPGDTVTRRGLRFTSLSRTLLDLAAVLSEAELDAAVDEARNRRKLHLPAIEATVARAHGHHGIGRLRTSVARHAPGRGLPRSEKERLLGRFLAERGYPRHERNALVQIDGETFCVDVLFPGRKVVLEFDSRRFHDNDPTFDSDRRRIRRFAAHGWQLVPLTSTDLKDRPDELDADVRSILGIP